MIEMLIKKELNLPTRENSIVCASIGFGAKVNILLALLARNQKNAEGIRLIRHTQQVAERNSFAHGFFAMVAPGEGMRLVKREVKEARYIVKSKRLKIGRHMGQFLEAFLAAQTFFKITDDEIDAYGKEIEADAKDHQDRD